MLDPAKREATVQAYRAKKRRLKRFRENGYWSNKADTIEIDGEVMLADDRDGKAFAAYVKTVESVLKAANGKPLTIREIKARLGDRLVERWIFDALATSHHVLHIQAYIDRFAYVEELTVKTVLGNTFQISPPRPKGPAWQDYSS